MPPRSRRRLGAAHDGIVSFTGQQQERLDPVDAPVQMIYSAHKWHLSIKNVQTLGAVMSYLMDEIASQPECWSKAIEVTAAAGPALPRPGERVAAIGCGSSLNVARCYAALREAAGQGETDAFPASEVPATR